MLSAIVWAGALAALLYLWRRKKFSHFKDLGISGPEPSLIFGNLQEFLSKGAVRCYEEWTQKYGDICGVYYGDLPFLLVRDVELLKKIEIKDFQDFADRQPIFRYNSQHPILSQNIVNQKGTRWKAVRSMLTPTFSTSKMKQMSSLMKGAVGDFLESLEKQAGTGQPFDIYRLFQMLTVDAIARSAFGVQTQVQKNPREPLFMMAQRVGSTAFKGFFQILLHCFSEISVVVNIVFNMKRILKPLPLDRIMARTRQIIELRKSNPESRRNDFLQLMLDAEHTGGSLSDDLLTATDDSEPTNGHIENVNRNGHSVTKQTLSTSEVLSNATAFMFAGYETTSKALGYSAHILSRRQDIQDKLREEIQRAVKTHGAVTYDCVFEMKYLEQVVMETLRYYPPCVSFITRMTLKDFYYNGLMIPKGTPVQVPTYQLHHDPRLWKDPEEFIPERFSPENRGLHGPVAYQPFGAGPRNCIGMRFSQLELKITLATLLLNYRLLPSDQHKDPQGSDIKVFLEKATDGVWVTAEKL